MTLGAIGPITGPNASRSLLQLDFSGLAGDYSLHLIGKCVPISPYATHYNVAPDSGYDRATHDSSGHAATQRGALRALEARDGRCAPYQRPELRRGEQPNTKTEAAVAGAVRVEAVVADRRGGDLTAEAERTAPKNPYLICSIYCGRVG